MRFSLKWILVAMAYFGIAVEAIGHPAWLYPDIMWSISILSNVYAATLAVCAPGRQRAAAIAFVLASVGFVGARIVSGFFNLGGFFPIDNLFLAFGIDAIRPDANTVLRMRAANAVGMLVFGLVGALTGVMAFHAADYRKSES